MKQGIKITALLIIIASVFACKANSGNQNNENQNPYIRQTKAKITFIELGSVRCIPCRQMQPVMKSVDEKYGDQVKVIFYDVWTDEGNKYAEQYKIDLIPTQVFLDKDGKEIFRHVGFYPEKEIDKFLQEQGLTIIN